MNRFNEKYGAVALIALAAVYMVVSLVTGHSAASEMPPDLSAPEAGVNVWQATALVAKQGDAMAVVDVRDDERYELYHLPKSVSKPGADAGQVIDAASGKKVVLIVGETNAEAAKLAGQVAAEAKDLEVHFLQDGVRNWYLTYEVPVPLFNEKPPPHGWTEAMATARAFVQEGKGSPEQVVEAVGKLSSAGYAPTQLEGKKKKASGGKKKKITGGCG
ncbi:MAG: rhodanese-like domain-containing protein [Myxococcota bacterium]